MSITPSEEHMWDADREEPNVAADDREINERYIRGEGRIVIETNREKLPGFVAAIKEPNYMDLRPFYQRRPRWNANKQSLLIESFIMNIPVPPIFLYERDFNSYEVMDGQQRITAMLDFYQNKLRLSGLEMWPELNGRFYHNLPDKLKAGIDRRSITSIVLLKESTADEEEASFLRETVFERLNTGGVELERQEIRNALYRSPFNDLLLELGKLDSFREIWSIPRYVPDEIERNPDVLKNSLFTKMGDIEIILRFFALRHADHYKRGMQGFLDLYMMKAAKFPPQDIEKLKDIFLQTLNTAIGIYGDKVFRVYHPETGEWDAKPHKAFYDAVMVALSNYSNRQAEIIQSREKIIEQTKKLFVDHQDGTFTGRANTKKDVQERIGLYSKMLGEFLN